MVQLNQQNVNASAFNHARNSHSSAISHLFNANQRAYTLSAGDVLSIQLWAYPEITPLFKTFQMSELQVTQLIQVVMSNFH